MKFKDEIKEFFFLVLLLLLLFWVSYISGESHVYKV
jgi:hypothetical protein